jgi:hypothetical protein
MRLFVKIKHINTEVIFNDSLWFLFCSVHGSPDRACRDLTDFLQSDMPGLSRPGVVAEHYMKGYVLDKYWKLANAGFVPGPNSL